MNADFVHALLRHLEAHAFAGAPRVLGLEPDGHELLTYLPGEVPHDLGHFSAAQVAAAASLLRELHDATTSFSLRAGHEVVCHGDASPCNYVFHADHPYALIDFDAAHPGERRSDVGYAAWLWLDVGNPDLDPVHQGQRIGQFVVTYGAMVLTDAIQAVIDAQADLAQRHGAPAATRAWSEQCLRWSRENRTRLDAGLALACQAAIDAESLEASR